MNIRIILTLIVLLFVSASLQAQDKMVLRGKKDTMYVKVIEVGTDEIKFKTWPVDENMPMFSESRDKIVLIVFQNGSVMKFSDNEFNNKANYADQNTMDIKLDPFSILTNSTSFSFEKSIKPGQSFEIGLGIIGLGSNTNSDYSSASGAFIRLGYKFINTPDFYMKGMRYTHLLKGGYVRPELVLLAHNIKNTYTDYTYNPNTQTSTYKEYENTHRISGYSFMLNFGKQWVFSDAFCVDAFAGIGIGEKDTKLTSGSTGIYNNEPSVPFFGFSTFYENEINLTFQAGLKVGYLFGKKKQK
jgi:hypothetical protein